MTYLERRFYKRLLGYAKMSGNPFKIVNLTEDELRIMKHLVDINMIKITQDGKVCTITIQDGD